MINYRVIGEALKRFTLIHRLSKIDWPTDAPDADILHIRALCLLPRLDMLKSPGLVWIPGVMAGMTVSDASPVYTGIYQFILVAMILAASGIAGLISTL